MQIQSTECSSVNTCLPASTCSLKHRMRLRGRQTAFLTPAKPRTKNRPSYQNGLDSLLQSHRTRLRHIVNNAYNHRKR